MQTTKNHGPQGTQAQPGCLYEPGRFSLATPLTRRSHAGYLLGLALIAVALLSGCAPPGPRAVLDGKKCLDRGDIPQAVRELRSATQLLPTNALAFSYLGLALHQAGQSAEAEAAYERALALDHDLTEVHYNLGCLLLAQSNKLDQAKSELTAYTLRRPNSAEGWLKLGEAQLRLRELTAAEKSFGESLRAGPQTAEALTCLGMIRYQRRRPNEAAQFFTKAIKQQPDYSPALLNLAIIAQQDLNDPRLALEKYREYLAVKPAPENVQKVAAIVRQLEAELNPVPREPLTNAVVATAPQHTNLVKAPEPLHATVAPRPAVTNASRAQAPVKSEPSTNLARISTPTNAPKVSPANNSQPPEHLEVVKLGADPVIKSAEDIANPPVPASASQPERPVEYSPTSATESRAQKKGFFQRINPMNLFGHDGKSEASTLATPNQASDQLSHTSTQNTSSNTADYRNFPRYAYRSPDRPSPGDKSAAEQAFASGVQEQQAKRLPQAIQSYRRAAQLDPAFFDAHYNLGLAATQNGNLPLALAAYETALAIEPESLDARYNFGLVLKQAGYVFDAVTQFEKILAKYPNDGRAHLALGNLYAQQLQDPARAREHYMAVLSIAPQSPQAGAIRYWLTDHPK